MKLPNRNKIKERIRSWIIALLLIDIPSVKDILRWIRNGIYRQRRGILKFIEYIALLIVDMLMVITIWAVYMWAIGHFNVIEGLDSDGISFVHESFIIALLIFLVVQNSRKDGKEKS